MDGEDLGLIDGSGAEEVALSGDEQTFIEGDEQDTGGGDEQQADGEKQVAEGDEQADGERGGEKRIDRADLPVQLRKALRAYPELGKQFPRLEKQLSGALFKATGVDNLGGLQKFREYAETLDAHGGPEGVAEMSTELENWRALDQGFERGDPKVLDGWAKDYPDGLKALLGPAIEKVESMDAGAHDRILSVPMWKTLDRCGVISTMGVLETALSKLDPEKAREAVAELGKIKGFLSELRALATRSKAPDPLASERQRLTEREQELSETESKRFYGSVRQDVNGQVMQTMNRLIRQELNGSRIKLSLANRLRKEINAELARAVNTQSGYQDRYKAVMGAADKDRAVRFIVGQAQAKLPTVVKKMIAEFNIRRGSGSSSGGRREGQVSRSGGGSGSVVTGRPKTSDVDFNRVDKSRWLGMLGAGHGQVLLKNGKLAKW